LAFTYTHKALYECYELYHENKTVAVLYDPQDNLFSYRDNYENEKVVALYDPKSSKCLVNFHV
jgi:hypothetical protein